MLSDQLHMHHTEQMHELLQEALDVIICWHNPAGRLLRCLPGNPQLHLLLFLLSVCPTVRPEWDLKGIRRL